jgi:outer membrane protein OmpA-like peptidoglycan-associated protein
MPWALAGVAAVALFAWLLNRRKPDLTAAVGGRAAPGDVQKVSGRQPSPLKFAEYLGGHSSAPWIVEGLEYETGSDRIVPASRGILDEVAVGLSADTGAKIRIVGHTDATGSPDANRELSRRRADAAKAYLIEKGVAAERIETAGMGADQPIASNDSEEGRSRNRRTEVFVVR